MYFLVESSVQKPGRRRNIAFISGSGQQNSLAKRKQQDRKERKRPAEPRDSKPRTRSVVPGTESPNIWVIPRILGIVNITYQLLMSFIDEEIGWNCNTSWKKKTYLTERSFHKSKCGFLRKKNSPLFHFVDHFQVPLRLLNMWYPICAGGWSFPLRSQ